MDEDNRETLATISEKHPDEQDSPKKTENQLPQYNFRVEQREETKLKSKYPGQHKPASDLLRKRLLQRGNQKYFDSGDYNLAKAKLKPGATVGSVVPTVESIHTRKHATVPSKLVSPGLKQDHHLRDMGSH